MASDARDPDVGQTPAEGRSAAAPTALGVDVGGSHVKLLVSTKGTQPRRFDSGPGLKPEAMVKGIADLTADWRFDVVSIGIPAPVREGRVVSEPVNLGAGWVEFDFQEAFGKPTKVVNDAAMQALGAYRGGKMLFLGLGTGLGSTLVVEGIIEPLELGHLPFRKATYEDYVGERGLKRLGRRKWQQIVAAAVDEIRAALEPEYIVLGGGNAKKLDDMPADTSLGTNADAFVGAFRLWDPGTRPFKLD